MTNVKGNGEGVRELRGVFLPPRRRHFPTGGGCARKSVHVPSYRKTAISTQNPYSRNPNKQVNKIWYVSVHTIQPKPCSFRQIAKYKDKKIGADDRRRSLTPLRLVAQGSQASYRTVGSPYIVGPLDLREGLLEHFQRVCPRWKWDLHRG